ncbi:MAG: SdrD B-like domain-containing protein [Pirellulaceae bacterium]
MEGGVVGRVYTDRNNNGSLDTDELGVQGIRLHLTGTDMNGAAVSRMFFTNSTGQFSLDEVLPGSYTLSQDATPFWIDGAESMTGSGEASMGSNSFTFELTSDGLNGTEFNFAVRGLDPKFSIWDALASSSRDGSVCGSGQPRPTVGRKPGRLTTTKLPASPWAVRRIVCHQCSGRQRFASQQNG